MGDAVVVGDVLCALSERARGEMCMEGAIGEARTERNWRVRGNVRGLIGGRWIIDLGHRRMAEV